MCSNCDASGNCGDYNAAALHECWKAASTDPDYPDGCIESTVANEGKCLCDTTNKFYKDLVTASPDTAAEFNCVPFCYIEWEVAPYDAISIGGTT